MDLFRAQSLLAQNILNGVPPYQRDYSRCILKSDVDKVINEDDAFKIMKKEQEELRRLNYWLRLC